MERLTKHYAKGITTASNREIICSNYCNMCSIGTGNCTIVKHMVERLAEIEDILGDDYDLERLKELVQADREGKCVLLPCKVGDTVYIPAKFEIAEREVYEIFVENSAKFYAKDNKGIGLSVFFFADDVGKTVFLTREEAEATLEKMKEGDK